MKNKKILLIGGSGIISSEVCSLAIEQGYDVTILNRGRRKNKINAAAKLVIADVKRETVEALRTKLCEQIFDVVVDFVSYDLVVLKKILSIVKCHQYIFTSTATVYKNKELGEAYKETDDKENDLWKYCINKRSCEKYLEEECEKKFGCYYTIVRPYVTYNETRFPYQVAPLEYYTILYRIMNELPVVVCNENTICTVTTSKEYAIGLVGLFNNPKAYNEDFHITSDNATTWKHIVEITANKLGRELKLIDIPKEYLAKYKNSEIAVDEIIGDKGRNMTFDNSKIKNVVPEFLAESDFDSNVDDILSYFNNNQNNKINYLWSGSLDRLIYKYTNGNKEKCGFKYSPMSKKDKMMYMIGRYTILYVIYNFSKKAFGAFKKLIR